VKVNTPLAGFTIRPATVDDIPLILEFIKELAEYEKLAHEVVATEEILRETLFEDSSVAEVILGHQGESPISFALFFYNFSTFLGRPGLYLEDLFVKPEGRGQGIGRVMLAYLARLAQQRGCGRFEWSVLDWNQPAIAFYESIGSVAMDDWTGYRVTGSALERLAAEF